MHFCITVVSTFCYDIKIDYDENCNRQEKQLSTLYLLGQYYRYSEALSVM